MRTSTEAVPTNRRIWVDRKAVGTIICVHTTHTLDNGLELKWMLIVSNGILGWCNPNDWRLLRPEDDRESVLIEQVSPKRQPSYADLA